MKSLSHESLTVYQRSIELVVCRSRLCETNELVMGEIQSQFKRALILIPLNIAEGSGRQSGKDQSRFYDIARGSALECGACLDVMVAMQMITKRDAQPGKSFLIEIVAMLTALAKSVAGARTKEDSESYDTFHPSIHPLPLKLQPKPRLQLQLPGRVTCEKKLMSKFKLRSKSRKTDPHALALD